MKIIYHLGRLYPFISLSINQLLYCLLAVAKITFEWKSLQYNFLIVRSIYIYIYIYIYCESKKGACNKNGVSNMIS